MSPVHDVLKRVTDGLEFLNETQAPDVQTHRHYKELVSEARKLLEDLDSPHVCYEGRCADKCFCKWIKNEREKKE